MEPALGFSFSPLPQPLLPTPTPHPTPALMPSLSQKKKKKNISSIHSVNEQSSWCLSGLRIAEDYLVVTVSGIGFLFKTFPMLAHHPWNVYS